MDRIDKPTSHPGPEQVKARGRVRHGLAAPIAVLSALAVALGVDLTGAGGTSGWVVWPAVFMAVAAFGWLGFRLWRRGIDADAGGVTVINTFRTRRLAWQDITDIGFSPVTNGLGMTVFYRLELHATSTGLVPVEAPGGGADPGKYLYQLREQLMALRPVGAKPSSDNSPEPMGFAHFRDTPNGTAQKARVEDPPSAPAPPDGSPWRAVAFGLAGALVGAGAYATFVILTGYDVTFVSAALGAIVGNSVGAAHSTLRDGWARSLSVLLTLVSLLVSGILIARQFGGLVDSPLPTSLADALSPLREQLVADPVVLLFWGLSLLFAYGNGASDVEDEEPPHPGAPSAGPARESAGREPTTLEPSSTTGEDVAALSPGQRQGSFARRWGTVVATGAAAAGIVCCLVLATVPLRPGSANTATAAGSQAGTGQATDQAVGETVGGTGAVGDIASIDAVSVGTCFNEVPGMTVGNVQVVPCAEAHDDEMYYKFNLAPGPYPGEAAVMAAADGTCGDQLDKYTDALSSHVEYSYYYPDKELWDQDRSVICYLTRSDGSEKLHGTVHATR